MRGLDYRDYYLGLYRDYYRDPFPHSLLSTREIVMEGCGGAECVQSQGFRKGSEDLGFWVCVWGFMCSCVFSPYECRHVLQAFLIPPEVELRFPAVIEPARAPIHNYLYMLLLLKISLF